MTAAYRRFQLPPPAFPGTGWTGECWEERILALLSEALLSYETGEIGIVALLDRSLPLLNEMRELGEDPVFVQIMEAAFVF